jgi:hypothetical protein
MGEPVNRASRAPLYVAVATVILLPGAWLFGRLERLARRAPVVHRSAPRLAEVIPLVVRRSRP